MLAIWLCAGIVLLDQWVKAWAVSILQPLHSISVIPGVLSLTYAENTGASFSMLQGFGVGFVVLTCAVLVLIAFLTISPKYRFTGLCYWSLVCIAGGAIGNMIDRILLGYVVDMIEVTFVQFAIFNIADIFVVCGGILFAVGLIFTKQEHPWLGSKENKAHA